MSVVDRAVTPFLKKVLPGFGKGEQFKRFADSLELPPNLAAAVARDPILERPVRDILATALQPGGAERIGGLTSPLQAPTLAANQVISSVGATLRNAETQRNIANRIWSEKISALVVKPLGGAGSKKDLEFAQALSGFTKATSPEVQIVQRARQAFFRDLAKSTEDPSLEFFSNFTDDASALFRAYQETFLTTPGRSGIASAIGEFKPYEALDDSLRVVLDAPTYSRMLNVFAKRPTFDTLTDPEKKLFRETLLNRFRYPDALPADLKKRVPKRFAQQYLIQGGDKILSPSGAQRVLGDVFHFQHRASTERIGKVLEPLIDLLPGASETRTLGSSVLPNTKQFTERMVRQFVFRDRTADEELLSKVFARANEKLNADILSPERFKQIAGFITRGEYRGFLSVDTAFLDITMGLNTWAETGKFLGPFFRSISKLDTVNAKRGINPELITERFSFLADTSQAGSAGARRLGLSGLERTTFERVQAIDRKLTDFVLSPMQFMHNLQRGVAFQSGIEKAISQGADAKTAIRLGLQQSSEIIEDTLVTQAQLQALNTVSKTAFGFSQAETAPLLQGPFGRLGFMFMHWTNNQAHALANGIARSYANADTSGLIRWTALTGFHAALPSWLLWTGVDLSKFFLGTDFMHLNVALMSQVWDAAHATTGEVGEMFGFDKSVDSRKAGERIFRTLQDVVIPQGRAIRQVSESLEAVKTGFGLDRESRLLYHATPMGELLRVVGVRPAEIKVNRELVREMRERTAIYYIDRKEAITGLLQGDTSGAERFTNRYGRPLTAKDVQDFVQEQQGLTGPQRQLSRTPAPVRTPFKELIP